MPQLAWNEYEIIECLAVLPAVEEHDVRYEFESGRVRECVLRLTVWQHESVVQLSLHAGDSSSSLVELVSVRSRRSRLPPRGKGGMAGSSATAS